MEVLIIDPQFRNQSGHQFLYDMSLKSELEERGASVFFLGNVLADKNCLAIDNFYPCLSDIISDFFKQPVGLKSIKRIFGSIALLKNQFDNFFSYKFDFDKKKNSVIFLHSLYIFELLAFAWFLKQNFKILIRGAHKIIIGFNFGFRRKSILETSIMVFLYKYIFSWLVRGLEPQLIYFSDGRILAQDFQCLLRKEVHFIPAPITNIFLEPYLNRERPNSFGNVVLTYVGGARFNKGFDLFVEMIEGLLGENGWSSKITVRAQIDVHNQQPDKDKLIMLEAASALEALASKFGNIRIFRGGLSYHDYYDLIFTSDIIVLPYRQNLLKSAHSNIFREAVVLGKVPVVTSNTTMAEELLQRNLGDLTFDERRVSDFKEAVKKAIEKLSYYQERMSDIREEWIKIYSAKHLVDRINELVS